MTIHKIKIYFKVVLICIILSAILVFMFSNTEQVKVKFLGWQLCSIPTYSFILIVGNGGGVLYLLFGRARRVFKDLRQLRQEAKVRQKLVSEVKEEIASGTTEPESNPKQQ